MATDYLNIFDFPIRGNQDLDFDRSTQPCASSNLRVSGGWLLNEFSAFLRGCSDRQTQHQHAEGSPPWSRMDASSHTAFVDSGWPNVSLKWDQSAKRVVRTNSDDRPRVARRPATKFRHAPGAGYAGHLSRF